jgi:hypothetical protein
MALGLVTAIAGIGSGFLLVFSFLFLLQFRVFKPF